MTTRIAWESEGALERTLAILSGGGVVAFPTDTLYGLGALIHDAAAIERLFLAKDRQTGKAIPVLIASVDQLARVAADVSEQVATLARAFWPGPLTLIVPRREDLPAILGPDPTVGVRVPDHPVTLALLERAGPMAVTSANRSGEPGCRTAEEVERALAGRVDLVLDGGRTPGGIASTVANCAHGDLEILRQGPISLETLRAALTAPLS